MPTDAGGEAHPLGPPYCCTPPPASRQCPTRPLRGGGELGPPRERGDYFVVNVDDYDADPTLKRSPTDDSPGQPADAPCRFTHHMRLSWDRCYSDHVGLLLCVALVPLLLLLLVFFRVPILVGAVSANVASPPTRPAGVTSHQYPTVVPCCTAAPSRSGPLNNKRKSLRTSRTTRKGS